MARRLRPRPPPRPRHARPRRLPAAPGVGGAAARRGGRGPKPGPPSHPPRPPPARRPATQARMSGKGESPGRSRRPWADRRFASPAPAPPRPPRPPWTLAPFLQVPRACPARCEGAWEAATPGRRRLGFKHCACSCGPGQRLGRWCGTSGAAGRRRPGSRLTKVPPGRRQLCAALERPAGAAWAAAQRTLDCRATCPAPLPPAGCQGYHRHQGRRRRQEEAHLPLGACRPAVPGGPYPPSAQGPRHRQRSCGCHRRGVHRRHPGVPDR